MHYHMEVHLRNIDGDIEKQIRKLIEKGCEHDHPIAGWWDWFQVGGRWCGEHSQDYDPETDPRNLEPCDLCRGTGYRQVDAEFKVANPTYTCNGCGEYDEETKTWSHGPNGPGIRVKFPTEWEPAACDVMPLDDVRSNRPDLTCHTLVVGKKIYHQEVWARKAHKWVDTEFDGKVFKMLDELNVSDGYLVTVDYHS